MIQVHTQGITGGQYYYSEYVAGLVENSDNRLAEEKKYFESIRDNLKNDPNLRDKYVAVLNKQVIGSGDNGADLAISMYKKHGYVPIFVEKVDEDVICVSSRLE